MATRVVFPQWRDENAIRSFPFSDFGPPRTFDGRELPLGLILDAAIHPANSPGEFYLASVDITPQSGVRFNIADGINIKAATGEFVEGVADPSAIALYDQQGAPAGVLVVNPATVLQLRAEWGVGSYVFEDTTAEFVVGTWHYTYRDQTTFIAAGEPVDVINDLYLVGEDGVRLTCEEVNGETLIRIHAIGDPLARLRACSDEPVPRFIREVVFQKGDQTIKCSPNERGEIFMLVASKANVDSALRLNSLPGELQIGFAAPN